MVLGWDRWWVASAEDVRYGMVTLSCTMVCFVIEEVLTSAENGWYGSLFI